jgi:hypothetical protein
MEDHQLQRKKQLEKARDSGAGATAASPQTKSVLNRLMVKDN